MEIWKDLAGYDGAYQVSNLGRVRSFKYKEPRILKPYKAGFDYLAVGLSRNNKLKRRLVHRLVALAFIPNPENKPQVNHINGIKSDNRVENLEWATHLENQQHASEAYLLPKGENKPNAKFTAEQVLYIRDNPDNLSIAQLAEKFCVSRSTIGDIQRGKIYKNVGGKIRKSKRLRLPDKERAEIRRIFVKGSPEFGVNALARKYKVSPATILNIVRENQAEVVNSVDR